MEINLKLHDHSGENPLDRIHHSRSTDIENPKPYVLELVQDCEDVDDFSQACRAM